jgi:hypothetical protein
MEELAEVTFTEEYVNVFWSDNLLNSLRSNESTLLIITG